MAADKLRGNMEPSDYKHVALGLIFLKHISDSFEAVRGQLLTTYPEGVEDRDEYAAEGVFWVPQEAVGLTCRQMPSSRRLARSLMTPWCLSKRTIHISKAFFRKSMDAHPLTR